MLNETAVKSTVTVEVNVFENVDRYVYLGKIVTQAGDLLPDIKIRIALGWAAFTGVAMIVFFGGGDPADATRPMPPSLASVVYTFEALAGSWGSVSAPTVSRIMGGAQSETNCK